MQHGHMDQVGYDTYCKLLNEVLQEMKGIKTEEEIDIQIELDISSFIPDEFIKDSSQKIEIYQDIALCRNEKEILKITDEIIDRYGKIPKEVENLIEIARIKNLCRKTNIIKLAQKQNNIIFYFNSNIEQISLAEKINKLLQKYGTQIKFSPAKESYITYKVKNKNKLINEIKEFLESII